MEIKFDNINTDILPDVLIRAAERQCLIVCQSYAVVEEIKKEAKRLNLEIKEPIPIQWFSRYAKELVDQQTPVIIYKSEELLNYLLSSYSPESKKDRKSLKYSERRINT